MSELLHYAKLGYNVKFNFGPYWGKKLTNLNNECLLKVHTDIPVIF